ncbi:YybS family protein [Gilvimarinus polysaccharolyticus]|uniref:hypothetical protein n=1 Tax=Gilvimarinus polysaccharolyticus TaxID=863921 RepID=UPI0006739495|nr:hypothetical protein [Gilvimarinus polysaccharolyticus]
MRGRTQAAIVALIGHWIPLLGPATVALVTLRRGPANGLLVLLWAILPAIALLLMQQQSALLAVTGVISVCVAAAVLRRSALWQYALMALVACNTLGVLLLALLMPEAVAHMLALCTELFDQLQAQSDQPLGLPVPDTTLVLALLAAMTTLSGVLGLILGRWWQSLLYNPGGFAAEFRALRLAPLPATVCALAVAYCYWRGAGTGMWVLVFAQPLLFAGIALVHAFIAARGMGVQWLVMFYIAMVVLQPLTALLVIVAFCDTWLNFRGRLRPKA